MKINLNRLTTILIICVIVLIVVFLTLHASTSGQNSKVTATLDAAILIQKDNLADLADITRVNGADATTDRIITDCSAGERERFDTLLDKLQGNISKDELNELNTLFYACGSFFADRKAVVATKLLREVEVLSDYLDLRSIVTSKSSEGSSQLEAWKKLAESELKTAEYFKELVLLQGKIIVLLSSGQTPTSPEVLATLSQVSTIRGQMLVLGNQIEVLKTEALTL
ncbi:hypothetical protein K2P47_03135 [Patescibacteria group bacterium]|nr:hypothetical protein [Patescibacteria group bacterium]